MNDVWCFNEEVLKDRAIELFMAEESRERNLSCTFAGKESIVIPARFSFCILHLSDLT